MFGKKRGLLLVLLFLVSMLVVSCGPQGDLPSFEKVVDKIISIGQLKFLGVFDENMIAGFMRLMLLILVFAVLFEVATVALHLGRSVSTTISLILAIMTAVFMPGSVLVGIGSSYATVVGVALMAIPIILGFWALHQIPNDTLWGRAVRIIVLLLILFVLIQLKIHAGGLTTAKVVTTGGLI